MSDMPSKMSDRNSNAIGIRHSWGPSAAVGSIPAKPVNISLVKSMPAWATAMRGSVCSVAVSGGGHGVGRLPHAQRPAGRVLGQQEAQRGGPGAGKAEPEQRGHDLLVVDLGVPGVPLLDLEPVDQVADDLVGHGADAHLVERRLGVQASGPGPRGPHARCRRRSRRTRPARSACATSWSICK